MAKSSINILKNCAGFSHNDRSEKKQPEYFLPVEFRKENEFDRNGIEAQKLLDTYIKEAKENYKKETGQKFQGRVLNFEAVVNLNQNHTMEDLKKLNENIEKEFGFRAVQTAIHRDEGHIKDGRPIYNYHAHIVFCNLDKNGKTLLKNMTKSDLSKLQDLVSDNLQMERGKPAKETGAKHKHHTVYRAEKEKEHLENENKSLKMELVKAKELQELNKELREELKQAAATREDYAKLEALNKDLKEKIKSKELTNEQLTKIIDEYKQGNAPKTNEIVLDDKSIPEKEKEVLKQFTSDLTISMQKEIKKEIVTVKTGLLKSEDKELNIINEPNGLFKGIQKAFLNQFNVLYELAKEKAKEFYKDIIKSKDTEISELKEKNKELLNSNFTKDKKIEKLEEQNKVLSTGVLEQLSTKQQKKDITTTPKAQTLEEILKSNPSNLKEAQKDLKEILAKSSTSNKIHRDR